MANTLNGLISRIATSAQVFKLTSRYLSIFLYEEELLPPWRSDSFFWIMITCLEILPLLWKQRDAGVPLETNIDLLWTETHHHQNMMWHQIFSKVSKMLKLTLWDLRSLSPLRLEMLPKQKWSTVLINNEKRLMWML